MSEMPMVDDCLSAAIAAGRVPGVAATVGNADGVLYEGAFGERSIETGAPMTADTVVWIASMTKAITGAVAMQQVERGQLSLDAPAGEICPFLGEVQVLDGFAADGEPILRPPKRPVTLRHLLTHSAGFAYEIWNADYVTYMERTGAPSIFGCVNEGLKMPLVFDPGDRWEYGINIDWVGKMVEAVTGRDLGAVMRTELFEPLAMDATGFEITPAQRERLAAVHLRGPDGVGHLGFEMPQEPEFWMGGGGLYSTVGDYLRFTRMILRGGELDGNRVLRTDTVAEMCRDSLGAPCVATLDLDPPVLERRHLLSRYDAEVGPVVPDQHRGHARGSFGRFPGVGRPGQQLLLDRSGQERHRGHGHAAVPVRRRRGAGAVPGVRDGGVRVHLLTAAGCQHGPPWRAPGPARCSSASGRASASSPRRPHTATTSPCASHRPATSGGCGRSAAHSPTAPSIS